MKRLSQLAAFLIVAMMFTACSSGYYAHMPRAKTSVAKHETASAKKEVKQQEQQVEVTAVLERTANTEVVKIAAAEVVKPAESKVLPTVKAASETQNTVTEKTNPVTKMAANKVVRKITQKLEPVKTSETQNVSNGTALILIIIGLVLGLFAGLGGIGYILLVVGVILLLLNLLGASY